jgi:hypothetical protein
MDNEDIKGNISINEYITGYNHQYIYICVCVWTRSLRRIAILIGKVMMINHSVFGVPCSQTNPFGYGGVSILRPFFGRGQGIKCINLDPQKGCYFDNPKLKLSLLMDASGMIKMIDWTIDWVISLVWPMNGAWYYRYFGAIFHCYDNILAELKFWGRSTHCSSGVGSRHSWMMLFLGRVIVW